MPETVTPLTAPARQNVGGVSRKRLAVVISHPIQHFVPLFVRLAQAPDVDLKVFYCCDWGVHQYRDPGFGKSFAWDIPLLDGYDSEFLPNRRRPRSLGFFEIDNPLVAQRLTSFAPDAVWVHGYAHRTSWRVLRWARKNSAAVLYFGDSELLSQRGRFAKLAKRMVLPRFFRQCDGFLTIGDNNEEYYRHYGVADSKMYRGAFPIDVDRFRSSISSLSADERRRLRVERNLSPEAVVVLFVGKLIGIKRPLDFVEAIARLRDSTPCIEGLIVGSGPLETQIRGRIQELNLADRIKMTGFVNQSEMPRILWLGDILAMCSERDPHPLAVSEAMAVGNAIVASDRVGCVGPTDAARPGRNAITYPCGDVDALAARLQTLATDGAQRESMRNESWELAQFQDVRAAAGAVIRFLHEPGCRRRTISPPV
ncbi:MAG TPA: glycosyltransferase family 4 protein [Planctomycetaceae bacterium]|jgi:glycosyltransferase involved in cell wall biosynthesis